MLATGLTILVKTTMAVHAHCHVETTPDMLAHLWHVEWFTRNKQNNLQADWRAYKLDEGI